ncbi:hypothetical protein [Aneurinibacillus tyrosinisolvens]|uniref:hypothetical protein n=1 Tax=Aneurinibacillus tyrosinisolvens TaxID=1443435 RepID=UPI00069C03B1|nr:hypothetical protein [Aneurinibacillus tyrosinisolvens]
MEIKPADSAVEPILFDEEEVKLSLKFGFLGLGMGGCSIAAEFAKIRTGTKNNLYPYSVGLVNTNMGDFAKIPSLSNATELKLSGYEKGAGRNVILGEQAFVENVDNLRPSIERIFQDREFVWIISGLGGGTGTGGVIPAVEMMYEMGFAGRVGLILTLPRNKEGRQVIENALARLQLIIQAVESKQLGSVLFVDNEMLFQRFLHEDPNMSEEDYLVKSNRFIAQTLHRMNAVSASAPYGAFHFDSSEFLKMLSTPGVLSISCAEIGSNSIDLERIDSYVTPFEESIQSGLLSTGYDLATAERAATSIITRKQVADRIYKLSFTNQIESILDSYAPTATEKPVSTYVADVKKTFNQDKSHVVYMFSIFGGLDWPQRVSELYDLREELLQAERTRKKSDVFAKISNMQIETQPEKPITGSPFGNRTAAPSPFGNRDTSASPFGNRTETNSNNDDNESPFKKTRSPYSS